MLHPHSACPICNNPIQDTSQEECDRCGWLLIFDNLSSSEIYSILVERSAKYYDKSRKYYNKIKELESREHLSVTLNTHQHEINKLKNQIALLSNRMLKFESIQTTDLSNNKDNDNSNDRELIVTSPVARENKDFNESQVYQSINQAYYHNTSQFADKYNAIVVSVNKESLERNRGNEDKTVIFEENNRGNYWLFTINEVTCLVPVADKYINKNSYTSTSLIFECHEYTPDYQKIQLENPAIVSIEAHNNPKTWRLQERGEIVFL